MIFKNIDKKIFLLQNTGITDFSNRLRSSLAIYSYI